MNKRNLQNENLDRIGRKLLDVAKGREEEIEQIVSSPMLFDSIKARIESEQREKNSTSVSGRWANLQLWNWHRVSAIILLLFTIGVISLIVTGKFMSIEQTKLTEPEIKLNAEQIENQPLQKTTQFPKDSPAFVKTKDSVIDSPKVIKQKIFKKILPKTQKSKMRIIKEPRFQPKQIEPAGEFYALAFTGNPVETGEELKIVRAELSRSSLFALGVNLPIENESEKIKTDLLVGTDGVARAIRLVNKTENQ